jgi:hypothetical protein
MDRRRPRRPAAAHAGEAPAVHVILRCHYCHARLRSRMYCFTASASAGRESTRSGRCKEVGVLWRLAADGCTGGALDGVREFGRVRGGERGRADGRRPLRPCSAFARAATPDGRVRAERPEPCLARSQRMVSAAFQRIAQLGSRGEMLSASRRSSAGAGNVEPAGLRELRRRGASTAAPSRSSGFETGCARKFDAT